MDKKELFKLWDYDKELAMWNEMKENSNSLSQFDAAMVRKIQNGIEEARKKICDFVLSVDDSYYRTLLTYRCAERKTWKEIAQKLGGSAESHRKALRRYLDSLEYGISKPDQKDKA